jgi:DNA-directed RNA polymerase subunit RPC12/RpoP
MPDAPFTTLELEKPAMTGTHEHKCSRCQTAWQHSQESNGRYRDHICPKCGFLELMVLKPGQPPIGPADYPQAVDNFLKVLRDSDDSARTSAALSLGYLRAQPDRAVPALATAAISDRHPIVRQAAAEALRGFGPEMCKEAAGCLWPAIAAIWARSETKPVS